MPNVKFVGPARESSWRRLAVGSWGPVSDPQIYGLLDLDARALLERLEAERAAGVHVTVTHLVARAVAEALRRCPTANVVLRRRRIWQRASVDVFMHVAVPAADGDPAKAELSGVKIMAADQLDLRGFVTETEQQIIGTRERKDQALDKTRATVSRIPRLLIRPILLLSRWLTHELNLDLSRLGVARDPFGSVFVTSLGMFGIETAFAPLYPIGGPPMLLTVGAITPRAVVEDGEIVVRPMLRIGATFDHRTIDGFQIAGLATALRKILEHEVRDAW
jgi:pyruvate dehydrogenase E2 component (dihydrolipoamide acetyltransferase)